MSAVIIPSDIGDVKALGGCLGEPPGHKTAVLPHSEAESRQQGQAFLLHVRKIPSKLSDSPYLPFARTVLHGYP